jgi:hypothetical protein
MPRLGGILLGTGILLCALVRSAYAQDTVNVFLNQAHAFPISFQGEPLTHYSVKVRFSHAATTCEPTCEGQTWSKQGWASQSVAWTELPTFQTDSSGFGVAIGVGRFDANSDDGLPLFAQVAIRKLGTSTTRVLGAYPLRWTTAQYPLQIEAKTYDRQIVAHGYVKVRDDSGEQIIPVGLEGASATTSVSSRSVETEVFDGEGRLIEGLQRYTLEGEGVFVIKQGTTSIPHYYPVIVAPALGRPNQSFSLSLTTGSSYPGTVRWYVDGQKHANTSNDLVLTFSNIGKHTVTAVLPTTGEKAEKAIVIESYPNIGFVSLVPNPEGSDTRKETITLKNNNSFVVHLQKWTVKNRTTQRTIKVDGEIAPQSEHTVTLSSFLTNKGGTFDLYNDANQLVDTVTYPEVDDSSVVTRNGILWHAGAAVGQNEEEVLHERISGVVTKPSGNTIDIETPQGPVRIVVHHTFDGQKPRLSKGDVIEVSGLWLRSGRGPYLSVRKGDVFVVIESSKVGTSRATKGKKKSSPSRVTSQPKAANPFDIPTAQAADTSFTTITLEAPSSSPYNPYLRWLFVALIAVGAWLMLDTRARTSK